MQDTLQRQNIEEGRSLEDSKILINWYEIKNKRNQIYVRSLVWSPNLLSDKSTQSELSHISLVQVDLEQIKYKIQSTFLDQMELQIHR